MLNNGNQEAGDTARPRGNRLRAESSLYLQQHADNPVDWYPWTQEALAIARREDRPIFLSSGYASCHWCHVMEREVFTNDHIAAALNRGFVCVKLDREESPEIDAAYMRAVQLLTGGGGWPMSVFLTPDLRPFFGGTYIPPDRFLGLIERIDALWRTRRADLDRQAGEITQSLLSRPATTDPDGEPPGREALAAVVGEARGHFDQRHGGQLGPMKFPVPVRWAFLLHWWRRTGDADARRMVVQTLEAMAAGGLRDHVGGGFHRYTVDADWTVPHFEKMLYDNAQLATLFLEAGASFKREDFTAVGLDVLAFLDRDLSGEEGPCYASIDADSADGEGTYYVWTRDEIIAAAGPTDGPPLADLLGAGERGNFEGAASVLTRRADPGRVAGAHRRDPADVMDLFRKHRDHLRATRDRRAAPQLDRKIITAWNGLAISAFARGFMATGEPVWRARAERIAAYLAALHRDGGGGLWRASNDGQPSGAAVLEDYALLAQGLLDLYQISGDLDHLAWARDLLATVQARFAHPQGGWYAEPAAATPLGRSLDVADSVLPSGGSATVNALLSLGALTGDPRWRTIAERQLALHAGLIRRAGLEMAGWLTAALRSLGPLHEVVVAGDPAHEAARSLLRAAWSRLSPGVVVAPLPAGGAPSATAVWAPALARKAAIGGAPQAFVCRLGACQEPVNRPADLAAAIAEGWRE